MVHTTGSVSGYVDRRYASAFLSHVSVHAHRYIKALIHFF